MNKNDSLIIADLLSTSGYRQVNDPEIADIFIVNTCTVRDHAENRALSYISSLKKWHNDQRILIIAGCMAARLSSELTKKIPYVDLIIGPDSYRKLSSYLNTIFQKQTRIIDVVSTEETYCGIHPGISGITAYVSIMRGCSNFCSYCIVPYVRGRARSRPADDIIKEVKNLVNTGVKEITLLGQNVNEYSYQDWNFSQLLNRIARETEIFNLRFLTSHPKDLGLQTIEVVKNNKNICPWFHLPLQSGSNRILKMMNRQYTREYYQNLIQLIRKEIPDATISTDIIVGFPTETEDEYNETIELVKTIKFDDAYMYRYSPRPKTRAARYKNLPESVIKKRLQNLIDIQNRIIREKSEKMLGKKYEVLIEGLARNGSRGKTKGNKYVIVNESMMPGDICEVEIIKIVGHTPIGRIKKQNE